MPLGTGVIPFPNGDTHLWAEEECFKNEFGLKRMSLANLHGVATFIQIPQDVVPILSELHLLP